MGAVLRRGKPGGCRRRPTSPGTRRGGPRGENDRFYFADHGSGMPRNKRFPGNSGLSVPLVVYIPDSFKNLRPSDYIPGGRSERRVSFVDFAPTVLSLAGIQPPEWMQGHAFLGAFIAPEPAYLHGFRGRMDEKLDMIRSVTDGRYVYLRNYMPHLAHGQHLAYMFQTPTTQAWHQLFQEGKLTEAQSAFWKPKPPEELYDLASDPDEIQNLASSAEHQKILQRLREAQRNQVLAARDVGFLPKERFIPVAKARRLTTWGIIQHSTPSKGY
ncbi:MAG: sulfatase-like hydrolase/transferase [Planctomycetota bacterium]